MIKSEPLPRAWMLANNPIFREVWCAAVAGASASVWVGEAKTVEAGARMAMDHADAVCRLVEADKVNEPRRVAL